MKAAPLLIDFSISSPKEILPAFHRAVARSRTHFKTPSAKGGKAGGAGGRAPARAEKVVGPVRPSSPTVLRTSAAVKGPPSGLPPTTFEHDGIPTGDRTRHSNREGFEMSCDPDSRRPVMEGQFLADLSAAFAEGAANAIRHAGELKRKGAVACRLKVDSSKVEIQIVDHGPGFSLRSVPIPRFKSLAERGRGIFMIRQLMDEVEYRRSRRGNRLILRRHLLGSDPASRHLDLLHEISEAILQTTDMASVYNVILDKAVEVFGVERASILVFDPQAKRLKVVASRGLTPRLRQKIEVKPGEGISGYVYLHAKPCLIEDIEKNASGWRKRKHYKSRSFISSPMIVSPLRLGQRSVGVINMTDRLDGRPFTRKDLRLLTTIANQAATYLHICQLLSRAKEAEFYKRELDIARRIQQGFIPRKAPSLRGLEMAGWLHTAQSVGGDYYDFIQTDDESIYLAVADVSGHHIGAALTMANLRSQLKALLLSERDPARLLHLLNRVLYPDLSGNDQFVSMILARFDLSTGGIQMANAGQRFPLMFGPQGARVMESLPEAAGAVLGVDPEEDYPNVNQSLKMGEGMVFYTDGLVEASDSRGFRFGVDRLKEVVGRAVQKPALGLLEAIKGEVARFGGEIPSEDDITVVVVKKKD